MKSLTACLQDMGGQDAIRPLWKHYYARSQGVVFVVDSADIERMAGSLEVSDSSTAADELHRLANDEDLGPDVPILIFANKQDLGGALPAHDVAEKLGVDRIRGRQVYVQKCIAKSGEGLHEGFAWLSERL